MIRSVMIKGIEALTLECFLAAKRAGIVDEVAASLKNNYPTLDWNKTIEYNIERMASHGIRRADEMDQVAETLRELGIDPLMASGDLDPPARDGPDRQAGRRSQDIERGPRRDARCGQRRGERAAPVLHRAVGERMNGRSQHQHPAVPEDGRRHFAARDRKGRARAVANGKLKGNEALPAKMTLTVGGIDLTHTIEDNIELE